MVFTAIKKVIKLGLGKDVLLPLKLVDTLCSLLDRDELLDLIKSTIKLPQLNGSRFQTGFFATASFGFVFYIRICIISLAAPFSSFLSHCRHSTNGEICLLFK